MTVSPRLSWVTPSLIGLTVGIGIGWVTLGPLNASPQDKVALVNPQERTLDANLYVQTSAEYRACCLQIYGWMTERLRTKLATRPAGDRPPAIVLDLDETVLDNSPFQAFLDRERLTYTDALWEVWERDFPEEVRLVPGAKTFIDAAEGLGVTVIYLSNRKHRAGVISALKHLGLNTEGIEERLFLRENTSDKTERRQRAETQYEVLLYGGDNLRDFSEEFVVPRLAANDDPAQKQAIRERLAKVDRRAYRWGNDWFVLPNPVYGEWQKPLENPRLKLRPTRMQKP